MEFGHKNAGAKRTLLRRCGGELGIRTLETFRSTAFRVLHLRPLGQLSVFTAPQALIGAKTVSLMHDNTKVPPCIKRYFSTAPEKKQEHSPLPSLFHGFPLEHDAQGAGTAMCANGRASHSNMRFLERRMLREQVRYMQDRFFITGSMHKEHT